MAGALVGLTTAVAHADTITLEEALRRAVERPTVALAAADTEAAQNDANGARLPAYNPELGIAIGPARGGGATLFDFEVSLSQTIERGGKRAARADAADARVRVAAAAHDLETTLARLEAWRAFELALVQRDRVEAAKEAEQAAADVAAATEQTQAAGKGTQLEVNLTTSEVGRSKHDRLDAESAYEAAIAELASAIGAGADERIEPTGDLAAPAELPWNEDDFVALALKNRPELAGTRAEVDVAHAEARAEDAEAAPDLTLGLSYGFSQDPDIDTHAILLSASIALPVRNRNQGRRRAARVRIHRAEIDDAWARAEVEREARLAHQAYSRAREAVAGFDQDVTGQLDENLELARQSFDRGKIDYFAFSQARRDLIAGERDYLDAVEEAVEARYAVLRAAGDDVP
ncbi:MAG: TolC family protein [Myxococcales bacterium]|nr:TolC family protein [Myxococcales bacterium]